MATPLPLPLPSNSFPEWSAPLDLTARISPYFDRHMVLGVLEFLQDKGFYNSTDIMTLKYEIASKTKMVDYAAGFYSEIHKKLPEDVEEKRKIVYEEIKKVDAACGPLQKLLDDAGKVKELNEENNFTLPFLAENHQVTSAHAEALWQAARIRFDTGQYTATVTYLTAFRLLCPDHSDSRFLSAQWGKLAALILLCEWENAAKDFISLKETLDNRSNISHAEALQQRCWLLHWALHIVFNLPHEQKSSFLDFLLNDDKFVHTISTSAPHLLRYLTAAVILYKRKTKTLQELCRLCLNEKNLEKGYRDPITEFLLLTCHDFNFDEAFDVLHYWPQIVKNDFFLSLTLVKVKNTNSSNASEEEKSEKSSTHDNTHEIDELTKAARMLLFETYCRIHKAIHIKTLAKHCAFDEFHQEERLLEAIKSARVDARIDMKKQQLILATPYPTAYQQLIDKSKSTVYRSAIITSNVEKRMANIRQDDRTKQRAD